MPASSLIFVVIVAIWAAYLLQHYVRRREDAAAIRSADDFSDAMRVLEKRSALHPTDLRPPRAPSYAVTPARPARPTVDVKRATPAGSTPLGSPLVARRGGSGAPGPAGGAARAVGAVEAGAHPAQVRPRPAVTPEQRRLRGVLLLVGMLAVPIAAGLAVAGLLTWVAVPAAVGLLGVVVVWLARAAAADRARLARAGRVSGRSEHHRPSEHLRHGERETKDRLDAPRGRDRHSELRDDDSAPGIDETQVIRAGAPASRPAGPGLPPAASPARPAAYDVVADEALHATASAVLPVTPEPAVEAPAGTWQPVPVPRPTYALKAKAAPRLTPSGIPADVFDTPEFADEAAELDERALLARRAVSQ